MFRVFPVLGLAVALVVAVWDARILKDLRVVGSCRVVATPTGSPGEWWACEAGKLSARPVPSTGFCLSLGLVGPVEFWSCPFESAPTASHV